MSSPSARRLRWPELGPEKAAFAERLARELACPDIPEIGNMLAGEFRKTEVTCHCATHGLFTRKLDSLWIRHLAGQALCARCQYLADPAQRAARLAVGQRAAGTRLTKSARAVQDRLDRQFGEAVLVLDTESFKGYHKPATLRCLRHPERGVFSWVVQDVTLKRWSPCVHCREETAAKTKQFMPGKYGALKAEAKGPWAARGDGGWLYEIVDSGSPKRYIGVTENPLRVRLRQHLAAARSEGGYSEFRKMLRERPGDFSIQPLAYFQHRWALAEAEKQAIAERGTQHPAGYNSRLGGSALALDRFRGVRRRLKNLSIGKEERRQVYKALRGELPGAISEARVILDRLSSGSSLENALYAPVRERRTSGVVRVFGVTYKNLRTACLANGLEWSQTRREATRNGLSLGETIEARLSGKLREIDNRIGDKIRYRGELYPSLYAACKEAGVRDSSVRARAGRKGIGLQESFDSFVTDSRFIQPYAHYNRSAGVLQDALSFFQALQQDYGLALSEKSFLGLEPLAPLALSCPQHGSFTVGMGVARRKHRSGLPVCSVCSKLATLTQEERERCLVYKGVRWHAPGDAFEQAGVLKNLGKRELCRHKPELRQAVFDRLVKAVTHEPGWRLPLERGGRHYETPQHALLEADASFLGAIEWTRQGLTVAQAIEQLLRTGPAKGSQAGNCRKTIEYAGEVYRSVRALCKATGIDRKKVCYRMKKGASLQEALDFAAEVSLAEV